VLPISGPCIYIYFPPLVLYCKRVFWCFFRFLFMVGMCLYWFYPLQITVFYTVIITIRNSLCAPMQTHILRCLFYGYLVIVLVLPITDSLYSFRYINAPYIYLWAQIEVIILCLVWNCIGFTHYKNSIFCSFVHFFFIPPNPYT
jgi:hypothetical protein